ncbi:MAG: PfkB family carbohydrate kinase [Thermomicrobiales bacterium]
MGDSGRRQSIDYAIYGKIIVDDIRLRSGEQVRSVLGGGGPQAAFGARIWSDSVGLLTRSGTDLGVDQAAALRDLDVDLDGWRQFPDIPTPRTLMAYDADEVLAGHSLTSRDDWERLLSQPLDLPSQYRQPKAMHLITELPDEPMVEMALALRAGGTLVSLEPLPVSLSGTNWQGMIDLFAQIAIVTPDWPSATQIAGCDDPVSVLRYWTNLGPEFVAIRHGARGSYVWSRDRDEAWHIPAVPTDVVDPTGAGNAYGGGLCVGWTEHRDPRLAGAYGAISASMLLRVVGLPAMSPTLREQAAALLGATVDAAKRL